MSMYGQLEGTLVEEFKYKNWRYMPPIILLLYVSKEENGEYSLALNSEKGGEILKANLRCSGKEVECYTTEGLKIVKEAGTLFISPGKEGMKRLRRDCYGIQQSYFGKKGLMEVKGEITGGLSIKIGNKKLTISPE